MERNATFGTERKLTSQNGVLLVTLCYLWHELKRCLKKMFAVRHNHKVWGVFAVCHHNRAWPTEGFFFFSLEEDDHLREGSNI